MRQRSRLRNVLEYCAAVVALKTLQWTPRRLSFALARLYTRLLDLAIPRLRRVARRNLAMALPEFTPRRHAEIVDGVFRSIARILVTFAKFPAIRRGYLGHWIRLEGGEYFDQAREAGRGVLVATAHLGNWELSAFAHALMTAPMNVVVRPLDNPLIDALVERRRALTGNRPIGKKDFARAILKALAANQAVGILIDQNAALDTGVFVDFFGVPASAGTGFAKFAAPQRSDRHSRVRVVERTGTALRAALLSTAGDDGRCTARHSDAAIQARRSYSRIPRPVAVDSPPLENAPARRGIAI